MTQKHVFIMILLGMLLILSSTVCFASYSSPYIEPTTCIKKGSTGSNVKWIQDMLNHCGYDLSVDGIFGFNTYQAVTNFQKNQHLQVDGIVGPNTISAIKKVVTVSSSNRTINQYLYTTSNLNLRQGPRNQL